MFPQVSVFWLNYNSMHVIKFIKRSLDAIFDLDYPNFELVLVDNGSNDGSREIIEKYVKNKTKKGLQVKFIRLNRNWGFSDGINTAYKARNQQSKYVAIINNDAIPRSDYLTKLVLFLEKHQDVGAVQGIVAKLEENSLIDSAGFFVDEMLNLFSPYKDKPINTFSKPIEVSYVEGTMPLYNVKAIKYAIGDDETMYVPGGFVYYLEDVFLSLRLWNRGYKSIVVPTVTGEHYRMATIKRHLKSRGLLYYRLRNCMALLCMTNSRYKRHVTLKHISRILLTKGGLVKRKIILNALIDGVRLGKQLKEKYGIINLYNIPLVKTPCRKKFLL
jgi:GT2 family glycosyltransferase